ncbi:MAG: hypothetical protein FWG98_11000 [Candidatus Cloacimonetes bacterium]|nr:hypothetical protein [Candidatus Cloacimonadota bacterium]
MKSILYIFIFISLVIVYVLLDNVWGLTNTIVWILMISLSLINSFLIEHYINHIFPLRIGIKSMLKIPISKIGFISMIDIVSFYILIRNLLNDIHRIIAWILAIYLTITILIGTKAFQIQFGDKDDVEIPDDF